MIDDYDKGALAFVQMLDCIPPKGVDAIDWRDGWFDAEHCAMAEDIDGIECDWFNRIKAMS